MKNRTVIFGLSVIIFGCGAYFLVGQRDEVKGSQAILSHQISVSKEEAKRQQVDSPYFKDRPLSVGELNHDIDVDMNGVGLKLSDEELLEIIEKDLQVDLFLSEEEKISQLNENYEAELIGHGVEQDAEGINEDDIFTLENVGSFEEFAVERTDEELIELIENELEVQIR
jgi:hypothetical protein